MQKISEAAIRLGEEVERFCPGPEWRELRGLGNWLRHQYDGIDLEVIWHAATVDAPALRKAVLAALPDVERGSGSVAADE